MDLKVGNSGHYQEKKRLWGSKPGLTRALLGRGIVLNDGHNKLERLQ